ncbi:YraN family protein [Salmonella enterica subsp. enterica serovar Anatum]|nr:YraN family protein [Salmonella enterica subsp. enterica serovar Anatum]
MAQIPARGDCSRQLTRKQAGGAAASVTRSKQHKLLHTARLWLARQNGSFDTVDCRFDVLAFTGNEIEWFRDAFNDHS